jgi:hypothetical protein
MPKFVWILPACLLIPCAVGARTMPVGTQSGTSCTLNAMSSAGCGGLANGDCGAAISFTNSSAITVTAPNGLPKGCRIDLVQSGAGAITVSGSGIKSSTGGLSSAGRYTVLELLALSNTYNLVSLAQSASSQPTPTPTPTPVGSFTSDPQFAAMNNIYGVPWVFESLWNIRLGGVGACGSNGENLANFQKYYAIKVTFPKSGSLTKVVKYFTNGPGGYGAGNGGSYSAKIVGDNGGIPNLSNVIGSPSNTVSGIPVSADISQSRTFVFSQPVQVAAGTAYHLVIQNVDSSPGANCTSVDDMGMYTSGGIGVGRSPVVPASQLAVEGSYDGSSWTTFVNNRPSLAPTVDFAFSDGSHFGSGYYEMSSTSAGSLQGHSVGGGNQVRETFTVGGNSMSVSRLQAAALLTSGSGRMVATLTSGGTTVATATGSAINSGSDATAQQWITWTFSPAITLSSGKNYNLTFSAPSGTSYTMYGSRDGNGDSSDQAFDASSTFHDGYALYSTNGGSSFTPWDTWGTPDKEMDLFFFFQ